MKLLSIDPGYERLGVAVIEGGPGSESVLYSACIQTSSGAPHSERLATIRDEIGTVISQYQPQALAIETLYFSSNQKTALKVAEARGVVIAEAAAVGLPVYEQAPGEIKVAVTGYGKSDKKHVTEMVQRLVSLTPQKRYDDEYDAIAVGLTAIAIHTSRS